MEKRTRLPVVSRVSAFTSPSLFCFIVAVGCNAPPLAPDDVIIT